MKAFFTGWANTLTYLRYGCFGTMQTGNGILLARALSDARWDDAVFYATIMLLYLFGLLLYRILDLLLGQRSSGMTMAPFYFLLLSTTDLCVLFLHQSSSMRYELCFVALAFGGMNSLATQISPVVTHAITGNLNRVTNAVFDYVVGEVGEAQEREAWISLWVTVAFLTGVGACAQAVHQYKPLTHFGFIPVAIAQWVWLWRHDHVFAKELEAKQAARYAAELAAATATKELEAKARREAVIGPSQLKVGRRTMSFPEDLSVGLLAASPLSWIGPPQRDEGDDD